MNARLGRSVRILAKTLAWLMALLVVVAAAGAFALQTAWGQDRLRGLIVSQANRVLTATLEIGRLEGSLIGGITLHEVRLSRGGEVIIAMDRVDVAYSLRQFFGDEIALRRIHVVRPRVILDREADGRWNLGALVRPGAPSEPSGTRRPVRLRQIDIEGGDVEFRAPLTLGPARLPSRYTNLHADVSFDLEARGWRLDMREVSWTGLATELPKARVSGAIVNGPDGWSFEAVDVTTPRSALLANGRLVHQQGPSSLDLRVSASRFAFQEWAGVLPALEHIAIEAAFDVSLEGPTDRFTSAIQLTSNGGSVHGTILLDTRSPGRGLEGAVSTARLDLAHWLERPDIPTDISGDLTFSLVFDPGVSIPHGTFAFDGTHTAFLEYETAEMRAEGSVASSGVTIDRATTTAYGANFVLADSHIAFDRPFAYRFRGRADGVDLRDLPPALPIPRVDTELALDFDATGQFASPFIRATAQFRTSRFLDATIATGATGSVDTGVQPVQYGGEGDIDGLALDRVATAFDLEWLSDPRYRGSVSGHFFATGSGSGDTVALDGGGRLVRADLFGGRLSDADVTITIADGSLRASYDGAFTDIDAAQALASEDVAASVSGHADVEVGVRDLLLRSPTLTDYDVAGRIDLVESVVEQIQITSASIAARLANGTLDVASLRATGPAFDATGAGAIAFDGRAASSFQYDVTRADLSLLGDRLGRAVTGQLTTTGTLTGPTTALRIAGTLAANDVVADSVGVAVVGGDYEAAWPADDPAQATARFDGRLAVVTVSGERIDDVRGCVRYAARRFDADLQVTGLRGRDAVLTGHARLLPDGASIELGALSLGVGDMAWRLDEAEPSPIIAWSDAEVSVTGASLVLGDDPGDRLSVEGTWRPDGAGALHVVADGVEIPALALLFGQPDAYGGTLNVDATISGTSDRPIVTGDLLITEGRVRQLTFERLFGRVAYIGGMFEVGLRLDQAPGVWLSASGAVPLGLFDRSQPERPMHVAIASTPVSLGLVEGLTDVVRDVTGQIELNVSAVGTSHDPRFAGTVQLADAGFVVVSTGARYHGGSGALTLTRDRVTVDSLQLLDADDDVLAMEGSVGTAELRFEDLALEISARSFEVLRNEFGTTEIDARLALDGRVEAPAVSGTVTIAAGELQIDRILDRVLFSPYDIDDEPAGPNVDAIAALNPWERLALAITLHVPNTLRMVGDNVQVASGTPLGVGNINLRVAGDLQLQKDPGGPLRVDGALDRLTGRYAFQGRRFDLDPASSVTFRGDLDPDLSVTVQRTISGVDTRVTIAGRLSEPELRLASVPPLDPSDILSLIVFNTSVNQLSVQQQEQLAVRAGTLAAGFLTAPLISALERTLGLDVFEVDAAASGARITIGDEIAPGLIARFSRQFGTDEYDEATLEYYLSRLFRIRATFSDAGSVVGSPFRRVERAGVDLLLFFSF